MRGEGRLLSALNGGDNRRVLREGERGPLKNAPVLIFPDERGARLIADQGAAEPITAPRVEALRGRGQRVELISVIKEGLSAEAEGLRVEEQVDILSEERERHKYQPLGGEG